MATVTGYTAAHMEVIKNSTVISGEVDANGDLILTTRGGSSFNAGHVKGVDFDIGSVPNASESSIGVVRLATAIETSAGTRNDLAVSPKHLMSIADLKAELNHTHTVSQITDYVSQTQYMIQEAMNGVPPADEDVPGTIEIASVAETIAGIIHNKAVTPLGVKSAIDSLAPANHTHTASDITDFTSAVQAIADNFEGTALGAEDLDTLLEPGFYGQSTIGNGTVERHYPSGSWAGNIVVLRAGLHYTQIAINRGPNQAIYVRKKYSSNAWSDWYNLNDWSSLTGKPSTFPPASHHHDDLYTRNGDLETFLLGKSDVGHTHSWSQITGAEIEVSRLRLTSTSDASHSSTGHALQIGPTNGINLIIDNNEIMARNNGAPSNLILNADGGYVNLGSAPDRVTAYGDFYADFNRNNNAGDVSGNWALAGIYRDNGRLGYSQSKLDIRYMRHLGVYGNNDRLYISTEPSASGGNYIGVGKDTSYSFWVNGNSGQTFSVRHDGSFVAVGSYGNNITITRRAMWIGNNGDVGYASSSRTQKQDLGPALLDTEALRQIPIHHYHYLAELAKREENANHRVPTEIGTFAEDVHELGLWQFVQYEGHGEEAVPVGIHYEMLSLAALSLAQQLADENDDLKSRLDSIEARLSALEN